MSDYASNRMKAVIDRLFKEAPKLTDDSGKERADQSPAVDCHVVLKSGQQIQGALSTTTEGVYRMLAANEQVDPKTRKVTGLVMVESFFDVEQISCIAVVRPVTLSESQPSSLIHTA